MSNTTTLDVMYSNFLLMYKAWQMALNAPGDVVVLEEQRRRAFFDAAVRLAETGIDL